MDAEWQARYELGMDASRQAGALALSYFDADVAVEWKADDSPVTLADRAGERLLREAISGAFPDDGFLGEEYGHQPGASGYTWIIDPIDGTRNFIRGLPIWGTLVALSRGDEVIAGFVAIPCMGQLFHALRGHGSFRDGRRLTVSRVNNLPESLMCYSSIAWFRQNGLDRQFMDLAAQTQRQRGVGDFYGFVLVAQGSADFMIDQGVHIWDIAPLKVIVEEAGGTFSTWDGRNDLYSPNVIASNGLLHNIVRSALQA